MSSQQAFPTFPAQILHHAASPEPCCEASTRHRPLAVDSCHSLADTATANLLSTPGGVDGEVVRPDGYVANIWAIAVPVAPTTDISVCSRHRETGRDCVHGAVIPGARYLEILVGALLRRVLCRGCFRKRGSKDVGCDAKVNSSRLAHAPA